MCVFFIFRCIVFFWSILRTFKLNLNQKKLQAFTGCVALVEVPTFLCALVCKVGKIIPHMDITRIN